MSRVLCHVSRVTLHPGWDLAAPLNNITQGHDLALLHLAHPVTFRCIVVDLYLLPRDIAV